MKITAPRATYGTIIVFLISALAFFSGWFRGFNTGYGAAMSDIVLKITTPDDYFLKRLHRGQK